MGNTITEMMGRRMMGNRGGSGVDWESIAKGMLDNTTEFSIPSGVDLVTPTTQFTQRTGLLSIVVPNGVTAIGDSCFNGCSKLEDVTLPSTVTSLGQRAFQSTKVVNVDWLNSVETVGQYAFFACYSLVSITFPATVTSINNQCCRYDSQLKEVIMEGTTPPTLGTSVFAGTHNSLTIYVPDSAVSSYQGASGWSTYASIIKPISQRPT